MAQQEEVDDNQDYALWVSNFSEDLWTLYQSKTAVSSDNHGPNTVFKVEMPEFMPEIEVYQKDYWTVL